MYYNMIMGSHTRSIFLDRHRFNVEQVKKRILTQFGDLNGEAESYADKEFQRLGEIPTFDPIDESLLAEHAMEKGYEFYDLLFDLAKQMRLSAVAGMYHQWEKDLRDFIERELMHTIDMSKASKIAWNGDVGKLFDRFEKSGWDYKSGSFYDAVYACGLIVNVFKHGKGRSLTELREKYPQYLDGGMLGEKIKELIGKDSWDYEWLDVSEFQIEELSAAIQGFWKEFPEQLNLNTTI